MSQDTIENLPLDKVVEPPQVRKSFPQDRIDGMRESLLEVGQLHAILVRPPIDGLYEILDGALRVRAMKGSDKFATARAVIVDQDLSPAEMCQLQLISNCQRVDLSAMEIATAVKQLKEETGWTVREIASKLGFSSASVSKFLTLVELPQAIQDKIKSGDIPASAGYGLSHVTDAGEQAGLADQLAAGTLTRDGLSGIVKRKSNSRKQAGDETPARIKAELSNGRSITVAGMGLTDLDTLISWLEELLKKARSLRPRGLEIGTFARLLRDEART